MKPFKISHHKQKYPLKWLNWIALGLGLIYFYWAADVYFNENDVSGATINLILGFFWLASGYVNLFWIDPPMPDVLLDDYGITVDEKDDSQLLSWNEIQDINLDNNTIFIHLDTGREEELKIWPLEYNELQTVKEKLRSLTQSNNIKFSSKY